MKILLDSDGLFALYVASDVHHLRAKRIFGKLLAEEKEFWLTNLVLQETATVMSYRFGQSQAKDFLKSFSQTGIKQLFVNEKLTMKTWEVFKKQKKKGISFIDCANLLVCQVMKIDRIFSFDRFYFRSGLSILKPCVKMKL